MLISVWGSDVCSFVLIVAAVHHAYVVRGGAPIVAHRPRLQIRIGIRSGGEVAGGAVIEFQLDLAGSVQLWRIRVQRPLALPVIEEARGPFLLLRRLAPISCRQASILPPRAARHFEHAAAISRNLEEAQGGRLLRGALRQRELPPATLDAGKAVLGLDGLADFLVRSEEHTSELQSLMRISYAVFCLK